MNHIRVGKGIQFSSITQAVQDGEYDLIMTDIPLPWPDGFDLFRRMRKDLHSVRIVFMSTYCNLEVKKKAESIGAFAYLAKPVSRDELFNLVDRVVDEKIVF